MSMWGVLCAAFGGLWGLAGLILLVIDLLKSRTTVGTIISNKSYTNETVERFAPTIRFKTDDGFDGSEERTFQSICYFSSTPYEKGEPIPVRYHPTNTKLNGINKIMPRFFLVAIFVVFAAMFIALGFQI